MRNWSTLALLFSISEGFKVNLQKVQVYGGITTHAYYFLDLLIGSPRPQIQSVIIDTGSPSLAIPCSETCSLSGNEAESCGSNHLDQYLQVSQSTTAAWLPCSDQCQCQNNRCAYELSYGEGSTISGYWLTDFVSFGHSSVKNPAVRTTFGCHTRVTNLFLTQKANGILGLAFSFSRNYISTIDSFFADTRDAPSRNIFSICLSEEGGDMIVGGWDPLYAPLESVALDDHLRKMKSAPFSLLNYIVPSNVRVSPFFNSREEIQWTPFVDSAMYVVVVTGVKRVGTNRFEKPIPNADGVYALVDSGATRTGLPSHVYNILLEHLEEGCRSLEGGCEDRKYTNSQNRLCFKFPKGREDVERHFPPFSFQMLNKSVFVWQSTSYLSPTLNPKNWCLGAKVKPGMITFGASFFVNALTVFDRERELFGFKPYVPCPVHAVKDRTVRHRHMGHRNGVEEAILNDYQPNSYYTMSPMRAMNVPGDVSVIEPTILRSDVTALVDEDPPAFGASKTHDSSTEIPDFVPEELDGFSSTITAQELEEHVAQNPCRPRI